MAQDPDKTIPFLAWRSLAISLAIAVVASVLYEVAQTQVMMAADGSPMQLWQHYLTDFLLRYGIGFPICTGAVYLAVRVQNRWLLNAIVYLLVCVVLFLGRVLIVLPSFSMALQSCYPVFISCPFVLLTSLLARRCLRLNRFFEASSNERIRFGMSTVFWGSTIVGLSLFLIVWNSKSSEKFTSELSLETLQIYGAVFDASNNRLSINSQYQHIPIRLSDAVSILGLGPKIIVDFVDCELTDETIALFKAKRQTLGKIRFRDCKVVKEGWPSNIITIDNELNEPLPSELPR